MLPSWFLSTFYCICLVYIFVGISIISDIFMDSINVITAATIVVSERTAEGVLQRRQVNLWNPTVANLTLMALGSSAPEIMLNVIETVINLGSEPGELGPSTIVGSAAFNLLVISGVSILAVSEDNDDRTEEELIEDDTPKGVKKIEKLGVFSITTGFSIFAYVWMYYVLNDERVEWWEAWTTFGFFWLLILVAWIADKI
jgi:solute carrier family 8 (sodium/calcium exchanger)